MIEIVQEDRKNFAGYKKKPLLEFSTEFKEKRHTSLIR